ncbi:hypothetical protein, partial [Paenibacillus lactis]|uniref:hypothetical protein n=1 Tax=Paenibacillus lactis TaxID=228574 RepID=UPI001AEB2819
SCWSNLDLSTRIAGGFLFRTLRELNWLKPQQKKGLHPLIGRRPFSIGIVYRLQAGSTISLS